MKFYCNAADLSKALGVVSKAVATKAAIAHMEGVLLIARGGILYLKSNNFDLAIEMSIPANVSVEGSIVLNCKMFMDIMRKLPDDVVEIALNDRQNVSISCMNSEYKIVGLNADEFPEIPVIQANSTIEIPSDVLKNMIQKTSFAISLDEGRKVLTGSLFEVENGTLTIVAVDGFRLALKRETLSGGDSAKLIIPGKTQNELSKILDDGDEMVQLSFSNSYARFETKQYIVTSRLIDGEFLAYKNIIPSESKIKFEVDTKEFLRCIERVEPVIDEVSKNPIRLQFGGGEVKINCESVLGRINDRMNVDYYDEEIEIGFNYKYLHDALSRCESEKAEFRMNSPLNPFLIGAKEDDGFLFMVLPVRINR